MLSFMLILIIMIVMLTVVKLSLFHLLGFTKTSLLSSISGKNKHPTMIVPAFMKFLVHHMGRIFILSTGHATKSNRIVLISDTTGRVVSTAPCLEELSAHCCLILTRDGSLMVIKKQGPMICEDFQFAVYRLQNYDTKPHWTKLSGIRDMMLILENFLLIENIIKNYRKTESVFLMMHRRICINFLIPKFGLVIFFY